MAGQVGKYSRALEISKDSLGSFVSSFKFLAQEAQLQVAKCSVFRIPICITPHGESLARAAGLRD